MRKKRFTKAQFAELAEFFKEESRDLELLLQLSRSGVGGTLPTFWKRQEERLERFPFIKQIVSKK